MRLMHDTEITYDACSPFIQLYQRVRVHTICSNPKIQPEKKPFFIHKKSLYFYQKEFYKKKMQYITTPKSLEARSLSLFFRTIDTLLLSRKKKSCPFLKMMPVKEGGSSSTGLHRTTRFIVAFFGGVVNAHHHHPEAVAHALGAERVEYAPLLQDPGPSNGCALFCTVNETAAAAPLQHETLQKQQHEATIMWCVFFVRLHGSGLISV
jgi:hypothetical protein